jgi:hypothetical protein
MSLRMKVSYLWDTRFARRRHCMPISAMPLPTLRALRPLDSAAAQILPDHRKCDHGDA